MYCSELDFVYDRFKRIFESLSWSVFKQSHCCGSSFHLDIYYLGDPNVDADSALNLISVANRKVLMIWTCSNQKQVKLKLANLCFYRWGLKHWYVYKFLPKFVVSELDAYLIIEDPLHHRWDTFILLSPFLRSSLVSIQPGILINADAFSWNGNLITYGTPFSLTFEIRISYKIAWRLGLFHASTFSG
jgi:hypothetical protein